MLESHIKTLHQLLLGRALNDLHEEITTWSKGRVAELDDNIIQMNGTDVIDEPLPNEFWHGVRTHQISLEEVEGFSDRVLDFVFGDVSLDELDSVNGGHLHQVGGYNSLLAFDLVGRLRFLCDDLGPPTGSSSDIDDSHARLNESEPFINLEQLES